MRLLFFLTSLSFVKCSIHGYRENIPRFRHVHNERHEVYLGDDVVLDCETDSKMPAAISWFRNDKPFSLKSPRIERSKTKGTLKVHHIDVSDQGLWSCRVFNAYGQITRNFTVEVIDFCDYFLIPDIPSFKIPMECVCLWRYSKESLRGDVDYNAANGNTCSKYASRMITRARKPMKVIPCFGDLCKHFATPPEITAALFASDDEDEKNVKHVSLSTDDMPPMHVDSDYSLIKKFMSDGDEDDEEYDNYEKLISPDQDLTELNITAEEPPHFPEVDGLILNNETHALPAGRTLKLNCRPLGYPEPQILWFKNGDRLERHTSRSTGYAYKFKRWSLEVDDALTTDSGEFHCEAINYVGSARKVFNVMIVDRMRRPPIIVPNILANQSVNINDTATFNCKVVSDLLPHIMWVRINRINGSYSYFNGSANEFMFNYTEMDTFDKAHVHHIGDESTLTIFNVTLSDQGIYACLSGNSLGMTMANATLTVNEFKAIHLLTGDEPSRVPKWGFWEYFWTISLIIFSLMVILLGAYVCLFKLDYAKKALMLEDSVGLVAKKKRVVVSKRPVDEGDESGEGPTSYQIQIIETPLTKQEAEKRRKRLNSESFVLSEYEVDSDAKWEVERERLTLVHMLGEGAFGEVWKATMRQADNNEMAVAVKKLKMSAHEKELIDLVSEMETFKVIGEHENVLRLLGCCTGAGPLYVVVELARHGNLRDFLRAHRPKEEKSKKSSQELTDYLDPKKTTPTDDIELIENLTQRHLVQFAWQVARGMNFLATKKIIHRDLAARNVLVADQYTLKISDFGLSRDVHCNDYYRKRGNGRLPIKWMALEALDSHVYTIESDVWSYGVLLWEIMTLGGTPYPTIAMPELYANLKEGYRMEPPHLCPQEVYHLMCSCWQEKMEDRPAFRLIVDYLDWMLNMANDAVDDGSQEFNEYFSERASASGPVSPSFPKKRKHRPLSAPVNLPSVAPKHTICDDFEPNVTIIPPPEVGHAYCNDHMNHIITPENSQLYIHKVLDEANGNGYVRDGRLVRAVSGVANQSLDSALGSPAWPSYDRASNHNASILDPSHHYYNTNKIQYLRFTFDESDMTRSRDSAIYEDSYHANYIQAHPLYSKILIKKNMTPRNSLPTKETIV